MTNLHPTLVTFEQIKKCARDSATGILTRAEAAQWARETIALADRGEARIDESAWELLTFLPLIDEETAPGSYLCSNEDLALEFEALQVYD